MDRARAVLGKIIGLNKHSVAAWRKLRELHAKEEKWDKALEAQKQVEKYADRADAGRPADDRFGQGIRYQIGAEALAAGEASTAVAVFRKILKEDSGFLPAHIDLGRALADMNQESEAVQAWYNGFELTGSPIFLTTLEEHYLGNEQPMEAIEALKHCIQRTGKDTLPRFYLGKLYFRLEMLDDALAVLSSLRGRAAYAPNLHYLLGRIHERRNHHAEAASEYRKVIKEMELIQLEYICRDCGETFMEWSSRCPACKNWNHIEVNFMEEISLEELGLSPAPIYSD
jgi:lipopolysaccharide biosynthesis regulator YciM